MRKFLLLLYGCSLAMQAQSVRIACGADSDYTASDGKVWLKDQYFTGGDRRDGGYPPMGTPDPTLYKRSRVGFYGDFSYSIPVPNGSYKLTLKFAETQFSSLGARVFNVVVNGTAVLTNFDLIRDAGYFVAIDKQFSVPVTNGLVNIQVNGVQNLGLLSAIAVEPDTASGLQAVPNTITFDAVQGGPNPPPQNVNITNGTAANWTATKSASWLTLSPLNGSTPSTLSLSAAIASLGVGTYTDNVSISSPAGNQNVAVTLRVNPPVSVTFLSTDTITKGGWKSAYGGDGYTFLPQTPAPPPYGQINFAGATQFTWSGLTADPRALQPVTGTNRVAACWYTATSFTIDVNLTDGVSHPVAIYALDWDGSGRGEKIDVLDGMGNVLDTRTLTSFSQGQYLVWNVAGHVVFRVTRTAGPNAVVSGVFFGGPNQGSSSQPVLSVSGNSLTFSAVTGTSNPASQSVSITNTGTGTLSWTAAKSQSWLSLSNTSGTAPSSLSISTSIAGLNPGTYTDTVTITASGATGSPKTVAVTLNVTTPPAMTASPLGISFTAPAGGSNPAAQTVAIGNSGGGTLSWTASKSQSWISLPVTSGTAPANLSIGVLPAGLTPGTYVDHVTITPNVGSPQIVSVAFVVTPSGSATFLTLDTVRQGSWKSAYGAEGYYFAGGTSLPSYAQVTPIGATSYTWSASSTELRALQYVTGTGRIAAAWYGNVVTFDLNLTDGLSHQVALYATDYDSGGRVEKIELLDPNGNVLDTQTLTGFVQGQYLVWNLSGHITIRATRISGQNAVISGLFFGSASVPPPGPALTLSNNSLSFASTVGGANPATQSIGISNTGGGTLSWTASKTQSWLSLPTTQGTAPSTFTVGVTTVGLAAGTYTDTVSITAAGATGSPQNVSITFTVGTSATLSVAPSSLSFTAQAGSSNPATQNLSISNTGTGSLNWTAAKTQTWLSLSATSGSAPATLTVGALIAGLAPGTYTDTITVTAADASSSPQNVGVTFTVTPAPVLSASPLSLTFNGVAGGSNPGSQSVAISNTGTGTLNWTASKTQSWLSLPATSGTAPSNLAINVSLAGLTPGTYTDTVTITASGATGSPQGVGITLIVTAPPSLNNTPSSLTFNGMVSAANPPSQSLSISNTGGGTLNWTATKTQSWLSVPTNSGTAPSSPAVSVNVSGLSAGTYTDTITISAAGAVNSPQTVGVTFVVLPPPTLSISATSASLNGMVGGVNTSPQTISITNTGGGILNWSASGTQSWLTLQPSSGTAPATLAIGANLAGLNPGNYTDTVTITAPGAVGSPKTVAVTLTVTSSAIFVGLDTAHSGWWKNTYGSQGYNFVGDTPAMPGYVQMSVTGGTPFIWTQTSTLTRALQAVTGSNRIAAAWYSSASFTIDLNFTDGAAHQLAMYASDYDGSNRAETVDVLDSSSGIVLNSQSINSFQDGRYLVWRMAGHVILRITRTGGPNALVNGLFFDPPPAAPYLNVSTNTVSFTAVVGGANPANKTVSITNGGGAILSWSATKDAPWLTISPTSGTAPSTMTLSVASGTLAIGTYTGTITLTSPGSNGSPQAVTVNLSVIAPPPATLDVSPNSLTFVGTSGQANPASQDLTVQNTGAGSLSWTASKNQSWLTLSASSGTAPSVLTIGIASSGLAPGTYTDTVTVTSPESSCSPEPVAVTFILNAPLALPVGDWSFNASTISSNKYLDASDTHLDATIVGGVVPVAGISGEAANFDGASGYLVTQPNQQTAMLTDLTLAAWIRTTNSSRTEMVFSKYDLSGLESGYMVQTTPDGYLSLHLGGMNVTGARDYSDATNRINDGNWHHFAVIIRPNQDIQFYIDGGLSSLYYLTTAGGGIPPMFGIGGPASPYGSLFTGSIDQARVYGRALTTAEIVQLYGSNVTTVPSGEVLYNGIVLPRNFPPPTKPTQLTRTPYYIGNAPRVIPIDTGRQLFVDDFLVEQTTLQRVANQATIRTNPVLTPGSPISAGAWFDPSDSLYKLWYYDTTPDYRYAYSTDGINWIKPTFPDVYVPNTNEVVPGGDTIWLDQEEVNPQRRWKSFQVDPGAAKIYVYFSSDGIHWGPRQDFNILSISDRTTVFYNPFRKVWINSDRGAATLPATLLRAAESSRARFYSESRDLLTWTPFDPRDTFWTGAEDQDPPYSGPGTEPPELYNLDGVGYESLMVGLFSWFHPGVGYKDYTLPGPILTEIGVGFSRDGFSWSRPSRATGPAGAFIPASNTPGNWNAYNTQSTGGGFLVVGDELWFYFSARTLQKPLDGTFSTGLATLRRDGFVSMVAGASQGTLITKSVRFTGNHMFVNVKNPSGQLRVEVLDAAGNVIPGFSASNSSIIAVDKTKQEITWSGANIGSLANQNVKFKFYLTNGSLYSFWVTPSAAGASFGYVAAGGPGFTGMKDTLGQ